MTGRAQHRLVFAPLNLNIAHKAAGRSRNQIQARLECALRAALRPCRRHFCALPRPRDLRFYHFKSIHPLLPTPGIASGPPSASMGQQQSAPAASAAAQQPARPGQESACPIPEQYRNPAVYNVYNQRVNGATGAAQPSGLPAFGVDVLDPKNNMPLEPNQQPCPGQTKLLSTDRVPSNIPKGGTDATWVYPSPQMFYNGERPP